LTLFCNVGTDWFPDGKHVAVGLSSGLVSVDVETGEQNQLTNAKGALCDSAPTVSPDGRTLAFIRMRDLTSQDIYLAGATGGTARQLTDLVTYFSGLTWTPDSRELVFAATRDGVSRLWRMGVNGGAASPVTSSMESVFHPTLARHGDRLAYIVSSGRSSLWRIDIAGSDPRSVIEPVRLIGSVRTESSPNYLRGGQKIAFSSNKAGPFEIWEADADGRAAVQLTHLGGPNNGTPRWSPDGTAIAFDSSIQGNPDIMVVTEEGRRIRRITNHPGENVVPSWSGDGNWIYFASNRNGDFQIYKVRSDREESPSNLTVQVTKHGGINGMESLDGKYLYFAKGRRDAPGLWRLQLDAPFGETEEPALESLQNWGWWTLGGNGIFFLEAEGALLGSKVHL
jgi:Tol biopolymer transport system component